MFLFEESKVISSPLKSKNSTNFLDIKSKNRVKGNKNLLSNSIGLAQITLKGLENFTPMVLGIISQKINITIDVIKIATIDINSSDNVFLKTWSNFAEIKLVIVTFKISSINKIVAIMDEGFFIKPSNNLPALDFFFIRSIWYLCNEKIELSVIEKNPDNKIKKNITTTKI